MDNSMNIDICKNGYSSEGYAIFIEYSDGTPPPPPPPQKKETARKFTSVDSSTE